MTITTLKCPRDPRYVVTIDPSEVYPDDPGQGTPVLVSGPEDSHGTYYAAINWGELACGPTVHPLPDHVMRWLESDEVEDTITRVLEG